MFTAKRGMVFWFDSSRIKNEDKTEASVSDYKGTQRRTRLLSGRRPHIIVSSDDVNMLGSGCTVVTGRSTMDECASAYSTAINIDGRNGFADVRYITTIDQAEIDPRSFIGFLTDEEMDNIDRCITNYLIGTSANMPPKPVITPATDTKRPTRTVFMGVNVSGSNVMADAIRNAKRVKVQYRDWTIEEAKEFIDDYNTLPKDVVMKKYGLNDKKSLYNTRYNLINKFKDEITV